jgi:leucine dehydrogenase
MKPEVLAVQRGRRSGAMMVVAIDSTVLGPGLGGARLWSYESVGDLKADALRLSHAMTLKAAAAGLALGGAKGVIARPKGELDGAARRALMHDFGDLVESLDGRYITAEDVGTGPEDMGLIGERTSHVLGRPREAGGSGDPSPLTAAGVRAAIRGCLRYRLAAVDLGGIRVAVIGLGHVGEPLARGLAEAGARLTLTDVDPRRRALADELGAVWIDPAIAQFAECDVMAPCALGAVVRDGNVDHLRCKIVCGAANNVLARDELADRLAARGIVYAPDFIVNSGGLMSVYGELKGHGAERARQLVEGIEETVLRILRRAGARGQTPLAAALEIAESRLMRSVAAQQEPLAAAGEDLAEADRDAVRDPRGHDVPARRRADHAALGDRVEHGARNHVR